MSEVTPSQTARREEIRAAIEADPTATNTAIAKRLNAARDTVIDVRRSLTGTTAPATDEAPEINVFSLPVHPFAAMFPMRADDDLDAMAESIKANGLRFPVVLGMTAMDDGAEPALCVIDGRNRIEACRRAKVNPHTVMLNGEDQDAYIADANLERRDLSKGQKAMLVAWNERRKPINKGGRGNRSDSEQFGLSKARISNARTVMEYCEQYVPLVIDGSMGLDEAYREANRKRIAGLTEAERLEAEAKQHASRFKAISDRYPDIAEMVKDEKLSLDAAEKEVAVRDEGIEQEIITTVRAVGDVHFHMTYWSKAGKDVLLRVHHDVPQRFRVADLPGTIDEWIKTLSEIREQMK